MSRNEKIALGVGGAGAVGLVIWLLWRNSQKAAAPRPASVSSGAQTIGNLIAQVGGAAVANLGKQASSALGSYLDKRYA